MESWLYYGLAAALIYGISGFSAKLASGKAHYALQPHVLGILAAIGVFVVFFAYYLLEGKGTLSLPSDPSALGLGLLTGGTWAVATVLVYRAFSEGANASQMAPIYNLNTLVVVILGLALLHEIPAAGQAIKVLAGAILITIGAMLVS